MAEWSSRAGAERSRKSEQPLREGEGRWRKAERRAGKPEPPSREPEYGGSQVFDGRRFARFAEKRLGNGSEAGRVVRATK